MEDSIVAKDAPKGFWIIKLYFKEVEAIEVGVMQSHHFEGEEPANEFDELVSLLMIPQPILLVFIINIGNEFLKSCHKDAIDNDI